MALSLFRQGHVFVIAFRKVCLDVGRNVAVISITVIVVLISGLVPNSILLCWLFITIKNSCKKCALYKHTIKVWVSWH